MEVKQPVVRIDALQQEANPKAFASDVFYYSLVLLPDALHHKSHQYGTLRTEFLQINIHRIIGAIDCRTVMDEVLHLDVQFIRLLGVLHVESIETAVLRDDAHVRLSLEPSLGGFYTYHVLCPVSLTRHDVCRTQVNVGHGGREDDMHSLVEGHLQSVRRNHAVVGNTAR